MADKSNEKSLSLLGFFAITATMVMTVYEYPTFATSGFHLAFFLIFGGFLWFIPVALCAAEMATTEGWEEGGIFTWTANSLGKMWGFAHIFFQWFQITVGFTPMLYFIVGALSYVFNWPAMNTDPTIKFTTMIIIFWALTFSQFGGTKYTALISKIGFFVGILIPAIILLILGLYYVTSGNPIHVVVSAATFVPDFSKASTLVVFVSFILGYMGVESSAVHVYEMKNPNRDYPLAMLILVIMAIVLNTLGGLTIAAAIPADKLNLSAGVVQTYSVIFALFTAATWPVRILGFMIAIGVIAEVSAWVVGPSHGMHVAAKHGLLPKALAKVNKNDVPVNLVLLQAVIVSFWFAVLTFGSGGSGNMSFLTSMSLTVVIYLVGYLLFFIAYLNKVYHHSDLKSSYNVPGGKVGKTIIAVVGFIVSIGALIISFVPPSSLTGSQPKEYETILIVAWVIVIAIPFIIYGAYGKKHMKLDTK
ncbi:glutamate:gamma-aminobutyrate antiporter [uncultured Clostridium sp.]|jgi:glutamate:gamma-aminobutyrate antiporter|uniref:glutamate:gamma-aminobutyrate antiporter n=1 Tax=uncultured Clostridium sp. TaxID=59620 RepID=UPI0026257EC2|nr:glutamate:gamma-aminobutyrate antiporter [uncultured Clostridium sp.]